MRVRGSPSIVWAWLRLWVPICTCIRTSSVAPTRAPPAVGCPRLRLSSRGASPAEGQHGSGGMQRWAAREHGPSVWGLHGFGWDGGVWDDGLATRRRARWQTGTTGPIFWCQQDQGAHEGSAGARAQPVAPRSGRDAPAVRGHDQLDACPYGTFDTAVFGATRDGLSGCHAWLDCEGIRGQVERGAELGAWGVKALRMGQWKQRRVVLATPRAPYVLEDFLHGVDMLKKLSTRGSRIVPLLGVCLDAGPDGPAVLVTPHYARGSADHWEHLLADTKSLRGRDPRLLRLQACVDVLEAFRHLHQGDDGNGSYIFCDCREGPSKALSQFLVDAEYRLVLNDLDATPHVDSGETPPKLAKCGHQQFTAADFVAPEQLWPWPGERWAMHRPPPLSPSPSPSSFLLLLVFV